MSVELLRGLNADLDPRELIDLLFGVPEVSQAFQLRANRRRPLAMDPSTDEEKAEIVEAIERVAAWLDDGFHQKLVDHLRDIAGDVGGAN